MEYVISAVIVAVVGVVIYMGLKRVRKTQSAVALLGDSVSEEEGRDIQEKGRKRGR